MKLSNSYHLQRIVTTKYHEHNDLSCTKFFIIKETSANKQIFNLTTRKSTM